MINYLGKTELDNLYKIGTTGRTTEIRCVEIQKEHKDFYMVNFISNSDLTKAQCLFIESYMRMAYEAQGFVVVGNDYIASAESTTAMIQMFNNFYNEAIEIMTNKGFMK